jgi:lysine-N-methylase
MLVADYMEDFKCIGSECPDTCCQGWHITIDKKTYKKYRKSHNPGLKPLFRKSMGRIKNDTGSDDNYAYIKTGEDKSCPFLTEKSLCSVQDNLGEGLLSNTCKTYPRVINVVDGTLEKSATLTCPEVARRALLNEEGISFSDIPQKNHSQESLIVNKQFRTSAAPLSPTDISPYFWELHLFSIEMLKNRRFALWQRLLTLGFMSKKIADYAQKGNQHLIPEALDQYRQQMNDAPNTLYLNEIPAKQNIQVALIQSLLSDEIIDGIVSKRFLECHKLFLNGLSKESDSDDTSHIADYEIAYSKYYAPFMEKYDYILENYLVNYVFRTLFPVSNEKDALQSYVTLVINYSIIRTYLVGMAGALKEQFDIEHVLQLIQSFSKVIEHNQSYAEQVHEFLRQHDFNQLPHMAILLRNQDYSPTKPLAVAV